MKYLFYLLAVLVFLGAIALGLYLGVWYCFVGGICAVITACKAATLVPMDVALGVLRFVCSGLVGWGSFLICTMVSGGLVTLGTSIGEASERRAWKKRREDAERAGRDLFGRRY